MEHLTRRHRGHNGAPTKWRLTLKYSSLFNTGFFFQPSDELAFFEASIDLDGLTVRVEEDWDGLPVESACHLQ